MNRFETALRQEWPDKAAAVLALIRGQKDPSEYPSVHRWVAQCYNQPSRHEMVACALNELLDMSGTEAIFHDGETEPYLEYLNAGDTYATTLLYRPGRGWSVGCWGDFAESDD